LRDYAYEQQLEDLQKVKQGIADLVSSKKRLQLQEEQLKQQADRLDGQAREGRCPLAARIWRAPRSSASS
jgi:phage shock protein A